MTFSLHNAFVHMPNGKIYRQENGIPMGDPMSPGMTIGTCGWMEREWMVTISDKDKACFRAKRYMDDILLFYTKHSKWDHAKFLADFDTSECYWKPLKLDNTVGDTFLETTFEATYLGLKHRIKNPNATSQCVWRYHHFQSCIPYGIKRQIVLATLKKVQKMASDADELWKSAVPILQEFQGLGYPLGILKFMCSVVARDTNNRLWLDLRNYLDSLDT